MHKIYLIWQVYTIKRKETKSQMTDVNGNSAIDSSILSVMSR